MADVFARAIKEPGAESAREYRKRVTLLALIYTLLFFASVAGIVVLVWQAQLFVTLSQRSNVETLTLAFFLVFFGYLALLSHRGALGAGQVGWFHLQRAAGRSMDQVEQRKTRALGPPRGADYPVAELNVILEREDRPGEAFELRVADSAGDMGRLRVDGARLTHVAACRDGSNDLLAYLVRQTTQVIQARGAEQDVDIVAWKKIDDELAEAYHGLVQFARNLQRQLGQGELWPTVRLTDEDCRALEQRLAAICSPLRDESFLPDWEYQAEHKLPVIPEPLGLVSLGRTESRADPVTSMGCALLVVLAALSVLVLLVFFPPWVPGS